MDWGIVSKKHDSFHKLPKTIIEFFLRFSSDDPVRKPMNGAAASRIKKAIKQNRVNLEIFILLLTNEMNLGFERLSMGSIKRLSSFMSSISAPSAAKARQLLHDVQTYNKTFYSRFLPPF